MAEIDLQLSDQTGKIFKFSDTDSLVSFLEQLSRFWLEFEESWREPELRFIKTNNSTGKQIVDRVRALEQFKTQISQYVSQSEGQSNPQQWLTSELNSIFTTGGQFSNNSWLWHGHAFVQTITRAYADSTECGNQFVDFSIRYLKNDSTTQQNKGQLMAYEIAMQEESQILRRRNAEKKSLSRLRSELLKKNEELIRSSNTFRIELENWKAKFTEENESALTQTVDSFESSCERKINRFESFLKDSTARTGELEKIYEEKLRLAKPAAYWRKQAFWLWWQGFCWLIGLFLVTLFSVLKVHEVLLKWTEAKKLPVELSSLQGAVFFAVLVSLLAFLIRALSKFSTSAFHLHRDANEREQLTYLYLALGNETEFDEESRRIILQSLFSRADSGLLTKDTSPTMPSVADILKISK